MSQECARLKERVTRWQRLEKELEDAKVLLELAREEEDEQAVKEGEVLLSKLEEELNRWRIEQFFRGEHDQKDAILSVNAGAGGTEAMDWAQMLLRMYLRYCERRGFKTELVDLQPGEEAGIKSATVTVQGQYAYGYLRPEAGVHRLVRISPFDANHRRHTSFAAVFVMPDIEEEIEIEIKPEDLRIDFFRAQGHGGQNVNKVSSAVRITHIPSGIVVQCQNERSQHQNRATAMKVLKARLYEREQRLREEMLKREFHSNKKDIEWGSQIRSYVLHPYQMVKDLRTGYETSNTQAVLDGELDEFVEAYLKKEVARKQ